MLKLPHTGKHNLAKKKNAVWKITAIYVFSFPNFRLQGATFKPVDDVTTGLNSVTLRRIYSM